ncbi:MAG: pyroglutamyl-peptidase I [Micrococcales bacterium]|nr:pyroglutamyl-peptidase I [Actinomycetota bacterium]NCA07483.1 pyroglutamyl-peptidase I [Micrococcales bacterium]
MLKVLVTGFEPFNNARFNPSEQLVLALKPDDVPGAQILSKVLPVIYGEAASRLLALVAEHKPDAVICFGQAEGRTAITPERFAVNLDDAVLADNAGHIRIDQPIHANGPTAYESTLPVKEFVAVIKSEGLPASVSLTAGTFVCNHIFYELQHALVGTEILSGFIHVPLLREMQEEFPNLFTMELEQLVLAAKAIIATLVARSW